MDKAGPVFLQLGAVGAIALVALLAVRHLYLQQITVLKEAIAREVAGRERETVRAERAEQKIEDLHGSIQRDVVPALVNSQRALEESHQVVTALAAARGS